MARRRALAITTDVTPRYCHADPYEGAKQAVAEACRNISAVGALPLAVTDNLNFGNPQKPEIMGQIVGGIDGIGEACRALDFPVIGGNCSLYNETNGEGILPTPAIGGVGLMADVNRMATVALKRAGDALMLIGDTQAAIWDNRSICARSKAAKTGAAPPVDLRGREEARRLRAQADRGRALRHRARSSPTAGLLVALAEMALAGDIGVEVGVAGTTVEAIPFFFGEDQARYVIAVPQKDADKIEGELRDAADHPRHHRQDARRQNVERDRRRRDRARGTAHGARRLVSGLYGEGRSPAGELTLLSSRNARVARLSGTQRASCSRGSRHGALLTQRLAGMTTSDD